MADEFVLTPGGRRRKSQVHALGRFEALELKDDHIDKLDTTTGKVIAKFQIPSERVIEGQLDKKRTAIDKTPSANWITFAQWSNDSGAPIALFKTKWVVPPAPETRSSQTVYLFNGIQNSTMICQPVLQWGVSALGGGDLWSVACWYTGAADGPVFHSAIPLLVYPGAVLVGSISLVKQTGAKFIYDCSFEGMPSLTLRTPAIEELTNCFETLEAYNIIGASDYPDTTKTAMTSIEIRVGTAGTSPNWKCVNRVTDFGQHCDVVTNPATHIQDEVDLWYTSEGVA
jgi:hypothetical protein